MNKINKRSFLTVINSNERGIKHRLGKYIKTMSPGLHFYIPFIHRIDKINISERVVSIPFQTLISKDNVSVTLDSAVQYKIINPYDAMFNIKSVNDSIVTKTSTAIRSIVSSNDINELLHNNKYLIDSIAKDVDNNTNDWGIEVTDIYIRDIIFDKTIKMSMATKAEADRLAEAKIINAKADIETAKMFKEAASLYDDEKALKLREFQLLSSLSKNPASQIYFYPSDIGNIFNKIGLEKVNDK